MWRSLGCVLESEKRRTFDIVVHFQGMFPAAVTIATK